MSVTRFLLIFANVFLLVCKSPWLTTEELWFSFCSIRLFLLARLPEAGKAIVQFPVKKKKPQSGEVRRATRVSKEEWREESGSSHKHKNIYIHACMGAVLGGKYIDM